MDDDIVRTFMKIKEMCNIKVPGSSPGGGAKKLHSMKTLNTKVIHFHLTSAIDSINLLLKDINKKNFSTEAMYIHIRHACWHLFHAYNDRYITEEEFLRQGNTEENNDFIENGQVPEDFKKEPFM